MNKSQIKSITKVIQKFVNDYYNLKVTGINLQKIVHSYAKHDVLYKHLNDWQRLDMYTDANDALLDEVINWKTTNYKPNLYEGLFDEGYCDLRANDQCTIILGSPHVPYKMVQDMKFFQRYYKALYKDVITLHETLIKNLPWKSITQNYNQAVVSTWADIVKFSSKSCRKQYGAVDQDYECAITKYRYMADIIIREIMCLKNLKAKATVKN